MPFEPVFTYLLSLSQLTMYLGHLLSVGRISSRTFEHNTLFNPQRLASHVHC